MLFLVIQAELLLLLGKNLLTVDATTSVRRVWIWQRTIQTLWLSLQVPIPWIASSAMTVSSPLKPTPPPIPIQPWTLVTRICPTYPMTMMISLALIKRTWTIMTWMSTRTKTRMKQMRPSWAYVSSSSSPNGSPRPKMTLSVRLSPPLTQPNHDLWLNTPTEAGRYPPTTHPLRTPHHCEDGAVRAVWHWPHSLIRVHQMFQPQAMNGLAFLGCLHNPTRTPTPMVIIHGPWVHPKEPPILPFRELARFPILAIAPTATQCPDRPQWLPPLMRVNRSDVWRRLSKRLRKCAE